MQKEQEFGAQHLSVHYCVYTARDAERATADKGARDQERTAEESTESKDGGSDSNATQTPQRLHLSSNQVR